MPGLGCGKFKLTLNGFYKMHFKVYFFELFPQSS